MISYILEVTICWAGFYGLYALLLRKTTFFNANRLYLLGTLLLGLLVPLLELPAPATGAGAPPVVYYLQPITVGVEQLEVTVTASAGRTGIDYYALLKGLYWTGVLVAAGRLAYGLGQIARLYRRGRKEHHAGYTLVRTKESHLPFSFFGFLFWSDRLELAGEDFHTVLRHEQAHINGGHSLDVLLTELLCVFLWCNPFLYFYRRSLRTVHEYLADSVVLQTTRRKKYGHLLLRQSQSGMQIALANHFLQSQLKQRIIMMTRHQSARSALLRYTLAIPLLVLFLLAFANRELIGQTLLEIHRPDGTIEQHTLQDTESADDYVKAEQIAQVDVRKEKDLRKIVVTLKRATDANLEPAGGEQPVFLSSVYPAAVSGPIQLEIYRPDGSVDKRLIDDPSGVNDLLPEDIARIDVRKNQEGPIAHRILVYLKGTEKVPVAAEKSNVELQAVDEMPRFPGCEDLEDAAARQQCANQRLIEFVYRDLRFPEAAKAQGLEGTVIASFVVFADGQVGDIEIVRDIGGGAGEEVLRVLRSMPAWIPGEQDGKKVAVELKLPVAFKMKKEADQSTLQAPARSLRLEEFSAAPNPASDQLQLRFRAEAAPLIVRLNDLSGREVFRSEVDDFDGFFDRSIDLSRLAKGTLLMSVEQGDKVFTEKIVVQ